MKAKHLTKYTSNSAVYRKAQKIYISGKEGLCCRCPYHRGENFRKHSRNWKRFRKTAWK